MAKIRFGIDFVSKTVKDCFWLSLQRPDATRIIDQFGYKRYQKKPYLMGYKSYFTFAQKYFVHHDLQAVKYPLITYLWSKVHVFLRMVLLWGWRMCSEKCRRMKLMKKHEWFFIISKRLQEVWYEFLTLWKVLSP